MLNINTPDLPLNEIKGVKVTRLSRLEYTQDYIEFETPRGDMCYYLNGVHKHDSYKEQDTDARWMMEGYVTITPVCFCMTDLEYIGQMQGQSEFFEVFNG